ncbi:MAG: hypothetical protein ACOC7V_17200 [Spirochaetota bacterium]
MTRLRFIPAALPIALLAVAATAVLAQSNAEEEQEYRSDLDWAQVRSVVAQPESGGTWRFDVTVEHNDEGWDHYADRWQVVHPETFEVYGERILAHPHDNEQPFTRSESGIRIPDDQSSVLVRARCTDHGYEGYAVLVDLTVDEGENYEIRR